MMREYVFRHNHPDQFQYFHEVFKEHLGETYGIMVYQEDVIKIAMHYGGVSAADGDIPVSYTHLDVYKRQVYL